MDGYRLIGANKGCAGVGVYTYISPGTSCNGWNVPLQQCKTHCDNNETPIGCPIKNNTCSYVIYYSGNAHFDRRCHLANELCKPADQAVNRGMELHLKKRKKGEFF